MADNNSSSVFRLRCLLKLGVRIFAYMVLVILIISSLLVLWLATGFRDVSPLRGYVENKLEAIYPRFSFSIGHVFLKWENVSQHVSVILRDVTIQEKGVAEEKPFSAKLPGVKLRLDSRELLVGVPTINDVYLLLPYVSVGQGDEGQTKITIADVRGYFSEFAHFLQQSKDSWPVQALHLSEMTLVVEDQFLRQDVAIPLTVASIRIVPMGNTPAFRIMLEIAWAKHNVLLEVEGHLEGDDRIRLEVVVEDLPSDLLSVLVPKLEWLRYVNAVASGTAALTLDHLGHVQLGDVQGHFFHLGEVALARAPTWMEVEAKLDMAASQPSGRSLEWELIATLHDAKSAQLRDFWPPEYAPAVRKWILKNLKDAHYDEAQVKLEMKEAYRTGQELPPDAIQAKIMFRDATVQSHPLLPEITQVRGVAYFDASMVDIDLYEGKLLESSIPQAHLQVTGMGTVHPVMAIEGGLFGPVQDVLAFAPLRGGGGNTWGMLGAARGDAESHWQIHFPVTKDMSEDDVDVEFETLIRNFSVRDIAPGIDMRDGKFLLEYGEGVTEVEGEAILNQLPIALHYRMGEGITSGKESQENLQITADAQVSQYESVSKTHIGEYVSGNLKSDFFAKKNKGVWEYAGVVDASDAQISLPLLAYKKPLGKATTMSFKAFRPEKDMWHVSPLQITGNGADIAAEFTLQELGGEKILLRSLKANPFKLGHQDIQFSYVQESVEDGMEIALKGARFDLAPLIDAWHDQKLNIKEKSLNLNKLYVQLERLDMANNIRIQDVDIQAKCRIGWWCEDTHFQGIFPDGAKIEFSTILTSDIEVQTKLQSDDAGALLAGLDMETRISGGNLDVGMTSHLMDAEGNDGQVVTDGKIILKDFMLRRAPILARLLSLASLTGIIDTLEGEGIAFKKLKGEFQKIGDDLIIKGIRSHGSALGVTSEGRIDLREKNLELTGAVVPAFAINSFLGRIPLVGDVLVGAKGEGVIATRYEVSGAIADPDIIVNPLSMLTPGFLRKIWVSD